MVADFLKRKWGLVPGKKSKFQRPKAPEEPKGVWPVAIGRMTTVDARMEKYCLPADNQANDPSCAGFAMVNPRECQLRRAGIEIPKGFQIDGRAVWAEGRRKHNKGDLGGGLTMSQAFNAAVRLGVYPKGSKLVQVNPNDVLDALWTYGPLVVGHEVTEAYENPNQINGYINPFVQPRKVGGHGWNVISVYNQAQHRYFRLLNHWTTSWGFDGCALLHERAFWDTMISDGPYAVKVPDDLVIDPGYKALLVRV